MNSEEQKVDLYVFDFDCTVIEENSDTCFYRLFPNGVAPQDLKELYVPNQWTAFMNTTLSYLKNKMGITSEQIKSEIESCHLIGGMKELFQKIKSKNGEIIITSDANSLFIDWILSKNNLKEYFSGVYTNPCTIENDQLIVKRFYPSHDCPLCTATPNICKSQVIREHMALKPNKFENIFYFGDGGNDFCPMKSLPNDKCTGFVRSGLGLEKRLNAYFADPDAEPFKCKFVYWNQALDFLDKI